MALRSESFPIPVVHGLVQGNGLGVTCVPQQQTNWCWAACAEMVLRFNSVQADKCAVARWLLSPRQCCQTELCNVPCRVIGVVDDVTAIYKHFGLGAVNKVDGILGQQALTDELQHHPVELGLDDTGLGSGHLVVAYGAYSVPGADGERFLVHFPDGYCEARLSYQELINLRWIKSWIGLHP